MPLALNYQPEFHFPFEPNKHYVYLKHPEDLEKLADLDPRPYAEASRELWETRFKPTAMARDVIAMLG